MRHSFSWAEDNVSLIISEQNLAECDGIDFLIEVRAQYPVTRRALVSASKVRRSFALQSIEPVLCLFVEQAMEPKFTPKDDSRDSRRWSEIQRLEPGSCG